MFLEVILEFRATQTARVTDVVEIRRAMVEQNNAIKESRDAFLTLGGAGVRGLLGCPNFKRPVLGCIEANFASKQ